MQIRNTVIIILALSSLVMGPAPGHAASRSDHRSVIAAEDIDYTPVGSARAVEVFKDHERNREAPRAAIRSRAAGHDGN